MGDPSPKWRHNVAFFPSMTISTSMFLFLPLQNKQTDVQVFDIILIVIINDVNCNAVIRKSNILIFINKKLNIEEKWQTVLLHRGRLGVNHASTFYKHTFPG